MLCTKKIAGAAELFGVDRIFHESPMRPGLGIDVDDEAVDRYRAS